MKLQREQLTNELRLTEKVASSASDIENDVAGLADRLWQLSEELARADAANWRELFIALVERIDLRFGRLVR